MEAGIADHVWDIEEIVGLFRVTRFNSHYLGRLETAGLVASGFSVDGLVETVELLGHPWFIASQFHPEFTSTPRDGHPLFTGFIEAARQHRMADAPAAARA